jgi:coenzyme F420-reducing hydrogenase alpha subunit
MKKCAICNSDVNGGLVVHRACAEGLGETVTPEMKAKVAELFEQSDALAEEQSEFIEELQRRLRVAEKVCYAALIYVKSANSPLAMGWDTLLGALGEWQADVRERSAE